MAHFPQDLVSLGHRPSNLNPLFLSLELAHVPNTSELSDSPGLSVLHWPPDHVFTDTLPALQK